jgi:hypothetical protein
MTICGGKWISSIAVSPDGRQIITGDYRTIRIWDATTGVELMSFPEQNDLTTSVLFSPDGKRIITSCYDVNAVKIWDVATGIELMRFDHDSFVASLAISPDGERIVTGSTDKTAKIWDTTTGAELMILTGHTDSVFAVAFSPDNKYIASGDGKGTIKLWDAAIGKELTSVQGHVLRLNSVAFSPDGKRIISSGRDGMLKLWEAATGTEVMTFPGHDLSSAIFSPDGKTIAIGMTLLESTAPPHGYGPRQTGAGARKLVEELHEKHGLYQRVIDELKSDKAVVEPVHRVALQIANARLWEDAEKLNQESTDVVSSPDRDIDMYQDALEKAQKANQLDPNNSSILTTMGMALYRTGAYEEVLETLSQSMEILRNFALSGQPLLRPDPANLAFKAMALHQLGRNEEAQAALVQLRVLCMLKHFSKDKRAQAFLAETKELLVEGGDSDVYDEPNEMMICHLQFEGNFSDSSGHKHHGTPVGDAKLVTDSQRGSVLSLDGDGDWVDCSNDPIFNVKEITISLWIKVNELDMIWQPIVTKGGSSWRIQGNKRTDSVSFACKGAFNSKGSFPPFLLRGSASVNDGSWHHVVGIYDGTQRSLYIDGKLDASEKASGTILANKHPVLIGGNAERVKGTWNGMIDDVRIYNYALDANQVKALHLEESR